MRWDHLFDDLEGQLEQELGAEELDLLAEEERLRLGRLTLRDRLRALADGGDVVRLALGDGDTVSLRLTAVGKDWIAGERAEGGLRASTVVPIAAVDGVLPTPEQLDRSRRVDVGPEPAMALSARLGLTFVCRDFGRRRTPIDVVTARERLHGTIDRVGRDHLDLAEHAPGEPRRAGAVTRTRLVPLSAIVRLSY